MQSIRLNVVPIVNIFNRSAIFMTKLSSKCRIAIENVFNIGALVRNLNRVFAHEFLQTKFEITIDNLWYLSVTFITKLCFCIRNNFRAFMKISCNCHAFALPLYA